MKSSSFYGFFRHINAEALKDQRGLDLPAWKKELFGVTDDTHEEAIL